MGNKRRNPDRESVNVKVARLEEKFDALRSEIKKAMKTMNSNAVAFGDWRKEEFNPIRNMTLKHGVWIKVLTWVIAIIVGGCLVSAGSWGVNKVASRNVKASEETLKK